MQSCNDSNANTSTQIYLFSNPSYNLYYYMPYLSIVIFYKRLVIQFNTVPLPSKRNQAFTLQKKSRTDSSKLTNEYGMELLLHSVNSI